MITWIIVGGSVLLLILLIVIAAIVAKKRGKKKANKLEESINKLKTEKEEIVKKEKECVI